MNEPLKLMFSQSIFAQSSVRKERLGAKRITDDGRTFRYAQNGGVALTVSVPTQCVQCAANHINMAPSANVAVGATKLAVTLGATAATENYYAGGYIQVNAGPGIGMQYRVASHPAHAGTGNMDLVLDEPIQVAMTLAASKISLIPNPWKAVVASTDANDVFAGIPYVAATISYYIWLQTGGLGTAIIANTTAVGTELSSASATLTARTAYTDNLVGIAFGTAGVTSQSKPVLLVWD